MRLVAIQIVARKAARFGVTNGTVLDPKMLYSF
jgi:hypothetical protein